MASPVMHVICSQNTTFHTFYEENISSHFLLSSEMASFQWLTVKHNVMLATEVASINPTTPPIGLNLNIITIMFTRRSSNFQLLADVCGLQLKGNPGSSGLLNEQTTLFKDGF